jgi:hypothetical protein
MEKGVLAFVDLTNQERLIGIVGVAGQPKDGFVIHAEGLEFAQEFKVDPTHIPAPRQQTVLRR